MSRDAVDVGALVQSEKEKDGILLVPATLPLLVVEQSIRGRNGRTMTLTLRSETGKRRILYDIYESPSGWRKKKTLPKREVLGAEGELSHEGWVPLAAILWAEETFKEVWAERARVHDGSALVSISDGTPIGLIVDEHREGEKYKTRSRKEINSREQAMRIAETVLTRDFFVEHWDSNTMLQLSSRYQEGIQVSLPSGAVRLYRAQSNTTIRQVAAWLPTIFSEAQRTADPRDRRRTLIDPHRHPFDRCDMPDKGVSRVVRNTHQDFVVLHRHSDAVDPRARFRLMLTDARYTGHRLGTICATLRSHLLLTTEEIAVALENSLCKYVEDHEIRQVAEYYASHHGAIFRPWQSQKQGASKKPKKVAQFDRVVPLGPFHRAEIDHYLDRDTGTS